MIPDHKKKVGIDFGEYGSNFILIKGPNRDKKVKSDVVTFLTLFSCNNC